MSKDVSFALDPKAGGIVLQSMAATTVRQSANAIAARARSMASSMTREPPAISVETKVGIIKRGARAIATISATGVDAHANYIGRLALTKAKDAGRL